MTLMQTRHSIAHAKRNWNLFVLELVIFNKIMQIIRRGLPTYLVSKNRKIKVWPCKFGYASNARIVRASKLLMGMSNFNKAYNLTKMYNDFKQSDNNLSEQQQQNLYSYS